MICSGTGHRPDKTGGYSPEAEARLRNFAVEILRERWPSKVISGMALGWDLALADAAIMLGIPFIAAIPFLGQESRWPEASQAHYRATLSRAAEIVIVCEGGYAAWKMQKRNEFLVNNCDLLLALWNQSEGGTANCVRYAEGKKPILNVWDRWLEAA